MRFKIEVEVEVERVEGKFASRDEIEEQIVEAISDADPGTIDGVGADGDSSYEVVAWDAAAVEVKK